MSMAQPRKEGPYFIGRSEPMNPIPEVLRFEPQNMDVTFKLRDCPFMEFHVELDRNVATVYDLMYSVAKHHGDTIEPDKVLIFIKVSEADFKPLSDLTQKILELEGVNEFYYNFDPIDGGLLVIPPDK